MSSSTHALASAEAGPAAPSAGTGAWVRRWAWLGLAALGSVLTQQAGYSGLFERLVAAMGAAALAEFTVGILRRTATPASAGG